MKSAKLELFKYKDLEEATGGFAEENLIGKSRHGELYEGRLRDGRLVTVKRPSSLAGRRGLWQQDHEDAFENEVDILTKVFSRRLVNLLGYSQDAGKVKLLVVEFMENSSLHSQLRGAAGTPVNTAEDYVSSSSSSTSSCTTLSWPLRVHLALQTAKALRALHSSSPPIVHRDIRAMNVFIDRNWNARLGEFGLARHHVQDRRSCAAAATPARKSNLSSIPETSEPETEAATAVDCCSSRSTAAAAPALISPETDVLSFGVLLLEIISGKNAMSLNADCSLYTLVEWALPLIKQGNALAICDPRIKLPLCATALKHMAAIAVRCLRPSAGSRQPTMTEVVEVLTKVSKLIPLPLWNGQTTRVINKSSSSSSSSPSCTQQQLDQQAAQPTSSCFLMSLDSHAMNCRIGRLIRLPMWLGFLQTNKKKSKKRNKTKTLSKQQQQQEQQQLPTTSCMTATKQSFVTGLGKSISSTFSKKLVLMSKTANQAKQAAARGVKRAKVSDDQLQQRPTSSKQRLPAATTATNPVAAAIPPPLGRVSAAADSDSMSNRKPLEANTNSRSLTIARHHHRHRQCSQLSSTRKQQLH
jgi:serine/threonine protein kinase